jgi:hypothetical protein
VISTTDPLVQLERAGYLRYLTVRSASEKVVTGTMALTVVAKLAADERFAQGVLYGLHRDVGNSLTDFRSYRGAFGKGSLQIVIDVCSGECYADVDGWNPYEDVVSWVGHSAEVVRGWLRRFA